MKYVLITPARNEERFITKTLDSMVAQTLLPERWVIVDDGSTDRTAELVQSYGKRFPWIELVQRVQRPDRSFAGKVHAFNIGFERVSSLPFEVIGNLDADLSFDPDYLEFLMEKFAEDPRLGVAGTPFSRMVTTQPGIALKAKTMLPAGVSCFGASASRKSAAISVIRPGESIGSLSRPPE